ncbi:MAG: YicC family protein, partial [Magnetospirillum sp.]
MPVASMTGYARAHGADSRASWVWEVKSVNGRGLEVRVRLPAGHDGLDPFVREALSGQFTRGSFQIGLALERAADLSAVRVNTALLTQLAHLCRDLEASLPGIAPARFDGLLALKGVLETAEPEECAAEAGPEAREAAMKASLAEALTQLALMREAEGARIARVLAGHLDLISRLAALAGASASMRPEAARLRLKAQVAAVLEAAPSLPEERIAQEVALIAVKSDVREELDRLTAHVEAARGLLAAGGPVGRKLDFLSQEFNREANTLCSKSSDVELTRIGLDLKA